MMDIIDYFDRRRKSLNEHYEWLTNYIKKIEPSPKIEQVLLLCDNFTNELTILNNEVNHRLEIVVKRQDEQIARLTEKIDKLHGTHAEIDVIKAEQTKFSELRETLESFVESKAVQIDNDIKKNEEDLDKRLPGVG